MKKQLSLCMLFISASMYAEHFTTNLGIVFNYARYEVGCLASQEGYLAGPHFDFFYQKPWRLYTGIEFDASWDAGSICTTEKCCLVNSVYARSVDYLPVFRIGYAMNTKENVYEVVPYTGLGYYHFSYIIEPNTIDYKYNQVFVPVGLKFAYNSPRNFSVGFDAQYRAGAYSRLTVVTPCVENSECDDGKFKLKYSHGARFVMPITCHHRTDKRVGLDVTLAPMFDWNSFDTTCEKNSDCIQFNIPTNKRWYLGVVAALGLTF